jgi:hypothetical protein
VARLFQQRKVRTTHLDSSPVSKRLSTRSTNVAWAAYESLVTTRNSLYDVSRVFKSRRDTAARNTVSLITGEIHSFSISRTHREEFHRPSSLGPLFQQVPLVRRHCMARYILFSKRTNVPSIRNYETISWHYLCIRVFAELFGGRQCWCHDTHHIPST